MYIGDCPEQRAWWTGMRNGKSLEDDVDLGRRIVEYRYKMSAKEA